MGPLWLYVLVVLRGKETSDSIGGRAVIDLKQEEKVLNILKASWEGVLIVDIPKVP